MQTPYVTREEVQTVLETGTPARVIDVEAVEVGRGQVIEDDPSLSDEERIRLLHEQGVSLNQIQRRVYGGVGGNYYYRVKAVLGDN
jgi:hypothetical protein